MSRPPLFSSVSQLGNGSESCHCQFKTTESVIRMLAALMLGQVSYPFQFREFL